MSADVPALLLDAPLAVGLAGAAIAIAAGVVQGLTGMGFAVVFTPLFVLIVPRPQAVVLVSLLLGAVLSLGVLVETRRHLQPRQTWPLLAGAIFGTPLGILVLVVLNGRLLLLLIAVLALGVAAVGLVRLPRPVRAERPAIAGAGLLGGFLNGSTSMGGSPPALLVSMQRWPTQRGRAALVAFNLVSYTLALASAAIVGVSSPRFVLSGLWLLPLAALGTLVGAWAAPRLSRAVFARVLVCVVGMSGLGGLISALWI